MKNSIRTVLILCLVSGVALAQSTASITQSSNSNTANVEQIGSNAATVSQSGVGNVSDSRQLRMAGLPLLATPLSGNTYSLTQLGDGNESRLGQNWGSSSATVRQEGDGNKLTSSKTFGNSNYYYGVPGFAIQGGSTLMLDQLGDRNVAGINQNAKANVADIDQVGSDNAADVYQYSFGGVAPPAFGNEAVVSQTGNANQSEVWQGGGLGSGRSNSAAITLDGDGNSTITTQSGDEHTVIVSMTKAGNGDASSSNNVTVEQVGGNNYFSLGAKRSNGNVVDGYQDGINHYHRFSVGGNSNDLYVNVLGTGNRGDFTFSEAWPGLSDGNNFDLVQNGDTNYATGSVSGDLNVVNIDQSGAGHRVGSSWYTRDGVVVNGNQNSVSILQQNAGQSAVVTQTGNMNMAAVIQK